MSHKKMKLIPFLYNKKKEAKHQWQWPSCKQYPKTLSFRAGSEDVFKTVNSVFLDQTDCVETTPESWFTTSSCESATSSTVSDDQESLEMVLTRGVQSERLFFEPGTKTSSILENETNNAKCDDEGFPIFKGSSTSTRVSFKESVMVALESDDPYSDFRRSMEEMVECHGLKDWECLEELLGWYLRVNGKKNHGLIVGAFVDLLVTKSSSTLSSPSPSPSSSSTTRTTYNIISSDYSTSYSSALSSFPSPSSPFCKSEVEKLEIDVEETP